MLKSKKIIFLLVLTMIILFHSIGFAEIVATPTSAKVVVNGKLTYFEAYSIEGSNYFKLKDIAFAVNGSDKQFAVNWDGTKKVINLVSGAPYSPVGSEMSIGDGKSKKAVVNTSKIYKDGHPVELKAYTIGGNNFFKLKDLAQAFNITVSWDPLTKTVGIDTATENAVAIVNNEIVDINTFKIYYAMYEAAYKQYYGDEIFNQEFEGVKFADVLREDILEMLVQESLVKSYVLSTGYTISDELFKTKFDELKKTVEEDAETKTMYDAIGVTDEFLKKQVQASIYMDEFTKTVNATIAKTVKLDELYASEPIRVKARHILVEDYATAKEVKARLDAGENFAELVSQYSKDTNSISVGGDLGYFGKGVMVEEFEEVAFSSPIGTYSNPVQTSFGYHIINVEAVQTVNQLIASGLAEEEVNAFKQQIKDNLFTEYYTIKVEELKSAATIETYIEKVIPKTEK